MPVEMVVVLRARDPVATQRFYERRGFVFVTERHGHGPEHVAATRGAWVLEIYPARPTDAADAVQLLFVGIPGGKDPDGRILLNGIMY